MTYRIFDSGFKMVGSPWGAVCNSTTNYRFGILGDASFAYNMNDFGTDMGHDRLTSQTYTTGQYYWKSMYQLTNILTLNITHQVEMDLYLANVSPYTQSI